MVTHPVLVDAALVLALVLLLRIAWLRRGAVVHGCVLVRPVHTVGVSVAHPALGDAGSPPPLLVLGALELSLSVTLPGVTLMAGIFVRIIQAIVVPITNVDPWHTVSIVTSEQVSKASSLFAFAVIFGFICTISTIVISITMPSGRNAAVAGTPEAVWRAGSLRAEERDLVRVVATVIVAVAEPVGLHTDVSGLALEVVSRARAIVRTVGVALVRGLVVLTVVHAVTELCLWNAAEVGTRELAIRAWWILTALLICAVPAIVFMVALPSLENTPPIATPELCWSTRMLSAEGLVFIRVVSTIIIPITCPQPGNALPIATSKLCVITRNILGNTHPAFIGHFESRVAEALNGAIGCLVA